jgi:heme a synthase
MNSATRIPSSHLSLPRYQPALAVGAALGASWVFVLVMLGAFTTSIGAGMVFLDWPLSNGSLNPEGWLTDVAKFAEHSHRLSAGLMTIITLGLAIWISRRETRPWLKKLAWVAVGLVFAQAMLGGLRVLFDHLHITAIETSVGRLFAMAHACLAQIYVCTLFAVALALSRRWMQPASLAVAPASWRKLAIACCALLVLQLGVAAVMRHSFAGLAIPTFPHSTPEGGWLPVTWNFRVAIHFAHRAMALLLTAALLTLAVRVCIDRVATSNVKLAAGCIVALLALQIALGIVSVLSHRDASYTTAHVLVGAALLATTFGLTFWSHRNLDTACSPHTA